MAVTFITAIMIIIGLVGIVVPVLPGLFLIWAGVVVWAFARHDVTGWVTLALATALTVGGTLIKYLLPGRRLRSSGIGWPTLAAGTALGVVGFFVIPVVGLFVGFVLGIYLAERVRLGSGGAPFPAGPTSDRPALPGSRTPSSTTPSEGTSAGAVHPTSPRPESAQPTSAWASTMAALVAVGWSIAIELVTGLLIATGWLVAVLST
jgi:uncharacterized protein YqgC (DUF456 family)